MIIFQCDICKRKFVDTDKLDSIVLYKKSIDYCKDCKSRAEETFDSMKKEIKSKNRECDLKLRRFEKALIENIKMPGGLR